MKKILLLAFLFLSVGLFAQTTYTWTGSSSTDWNTAGNWSPSGVPSSSDHITLNTASGNQPLLDASRSVTNITVSAGTIDLTGYTLTVTGTTSLTGGNINNGLIFFNNYVTAFEGTTFSARVNVVTYTITIANTTFNEKIFINKIGGSEDVSYGGNTFNDSLIVKTAQKIILYAESDDHYNGDIVISTQTGNNLRVNFGDGSNKGILANGKTIFINTDSAFVSDIILFKFIQIGPATQNFTGLGTLLLDSCKFDGKVNINSYYYNFRKCIFNNKVLITNIDDGVLNFDYVEGGCVFNDTIQIDNIGARRLYLDSYYPSIYNNHFIVSNADSLGEIHIGNYYNAFGLDTNKRILIGDNGFEEGVLEIYNFIQPDTSSFELLLGTNAHLSIQQSTFNGNVNFEAGDIVVDISTVFNDTTSMSITGDYYSWLVAGNYNSVLNLNYSGDSALYFNGSIHKDLFMSNIGSGNIFIAAMGVYENATLENNGTGTFKISYAQIFGDITFVTDSLFDTGTGTGPGISLSDTSAQEINKIGNGIVIVDILYVIKPYGSGRLTINTPLCITGDFYVGNDSKIKITSPNFLQFENNAICSVENNAYIEGIISKVGNDAFIFPLGKNGVRKNIGISAPSDSLSKFTAEYFDTTHVLGSVIDTGIVGINRCEYWTLNRNNSSDKVLVALPYNSPCNNTTGFRVVGWDSTKWKNYGYSSYDPYNFIFTASDSADIFSAFTIGWDSCTSSLVYADITVTDSSLCDGFQILSTADTLFPHLWSTGDTTQYITAVDSGRYVLMLSDTLGCINSDTVNLNISHVLNASLPEEKIVCIGTELLLDNLVVSGGNGTNYYNWSPGVNLNDSTIAIPTALDNETRIYTVEVTDGNGCQSSSSMKLIINPLSTPPRKKVNAQSNIVID